MTSSTQDVPPWSGLDMSTQSLTAKMAFRFCFVYFGLYCVTGRICYSFIFPDPDNPGLVALWPLRAVPIWIAVHIFRLGPPAYSETGSGDKIFDYMVVVTLFFFALVATGVWFLFDGGRNSYPGLKKWFRVFIRMCLGGQLIAWGIVKVIPLQMPYPSLATLVEPFGNFSPMSVLWSSIGAAPLYELFAGCVELISGVLLIVPRTAVLGAMIAMADMIQVFALNVAFDVSEKLHSFHFFLLAVFLLVPDLGRFFNFLVFDRQSAPPNRPTLFVTKRANQIAFATQVLFAVWLIGLYFFTLLAIWHGEISGGAPKSPLYGIWNVDRLTVDEHDQPSLVDDHNGWRRIIFDHPTRAILQHLDDSFSRYRVSIDDKITGVALTKSDDITRKADFAIQRPAFDHLILDGYMEGHKVHVEMKRLDERSLPLVNRGFHWTQESPFIR